MERGFEQLIIPALILLVALLNSLVQWARRNTRKEQPADVTDVEADMPLLDDEGVTAPDSPPVREEVHPVRMLAPPRAPGVQIDARHGIVLMTILGRCRGLEPPSRD